MLDAVKTSLLRLPKSIHHAVMMTAGTEWQGTAARTPRLQAEPGTACACYPLALP